MLVTLVLTALTGILSLLPGLLLSAALGARPRHAEAK
jgi:hypothetical protein